MDFIKNKLVIGAVFVIVGILGIGFFLTSSKSSNDSVTPGDQIQDIKQLTPDDIGLELSLRSDKKAVIIRATIVKGIKSLEYELTYDAEVSEEGEIVNVPRGAVGELKIKSGVAEARPDLGTCSANVCKYDKITSDIKVVIKVTFENGEIGAVEDKILFEK